MNVIYRLLGYSKYKYTHVNAAVLIQKRFQEFKNKQEEDRKRLIKSINATYADSGFTVITECKDGIPIMYKERIKEHKIEDDDYYEMLYYRNERKRIKNNSPKENKLLLIKKN